MLLHCAEMKHEAQIRREQSVRANVSTLSSWRTKTSGHNMAVMLSRSGDTPRRCMGYRMSVHCKKANSYLTVGTWHSQRSFWNCVMYATTSDSNPGWPKSYWRSTFLAVDLVSWSGMNESYRLCFIASSAVPLLLHIPLSAVAWIPQVGTEWLSQTVLEEASSGGRGGGLWVGGTLRCQRLRRLVNLQFTLSREE